MSKIIKSDNIHKFLVLNRSLFEETLLNEAGNVSDKINDIHLIGNINLLDNAHQLVLLVVDKKKEEVREFAQKEGIVWAKNRMTLSFKLEWVRAIRKTFWKFLNQFYILTGKTEKRSDKFYQETSDYNELIDSFMNSFFISYSKYKDELIEKQQMLVDNLSVPIIPITPNVSILPLIGTIDTNCANIIEEKVLLEVGKLRIQTLIMDLSGIAEMDNEAIKLFLKILDGITMMGSELVITGLRPEIVRNIINLDIQFATKAKTKATLQKALQDYLHIDFTKTSQGIINDLLSN